MVEIHLCEDHAKEKGVFLNQTFSADDLFSNFSEALNGPSIAEEISKLVCPTCGMTYADFSKSGRLGCSECYQSFRSALLPLIKRVQRSATHKGKRPVSSVKKVRRPTVLQKLQKKMEQCIADENFEEAAKIRDEIKELQKRKKSTKKNGS